MRTLIASALLSGAFVAPAGAGPDRSEVLFTKVLDSSTPMPGGQGSLGSLAIGEPGDLPSGRRAYGKPHLTMDQHGNLAFFAGSRVFAIIDGEIHLVSEPRGRAGHIEIEEARVTFAHYGDSSLNGGIFRWNPGGDPLEVAGPRTFVPDGGACLFWTREEHGVAGRPFQVDGDATLFFGTSNDRAYDDGQRFDCDDLDGGFLWRLGSIERIEDRVSWASIDAGLLAFIRDGVLYARSIGEASQRIVGPGDPIPGDSGALRTIDAFEVAAGRVAFRGGQQGDPTRSSVFLWERGVISLVAEEGMQLPGGRTLERIDSGAGLRLGDDRIAIFGWDGQRRLIYLASLEHGWERVVDLSGPDRYYAAGGMGEFDRNQLVIEGSRIVDAMREDGVPIQRFQRLVSVIRPDGSLLDVLGEDDVLGGRRVGVPFSGDLRGNELALGVSNDSGQHVFVAELPPMDVEIDVRPGRPRDRIRASSRRPLRVALRGSETFQVEDVEPDTLALGPDAAQPVGPAKLRDVNGDGWDDLVLRFRPRETGIDAGASELCLSGETLDGVGFEGCDAIRTRGRARAPAR